MSDSVWNKKGGTLSDKSARQEYGLTQEEILEAIQAGKLQFHQNHIHGNPYFRLLQEEVEALVLDKYGKSHLDKKKRETELAQINKQLKMLKSQITSLEKRKAAVEESLGDS